ncbi:MAG: Rne/Rng family ribonuclease [Bacteroidota bacterium]
MSNELIINSTQDGCRIALLKNKQLAEFHYEDDNAQYAVGDLYYGTIKKVVQGLNAAFVDVGYEKDAFLHYLDLGPNIRSLKKFTKFAQTRKNTTHKLGKIKFEPEIDKLGKITDVFTKGDRVLVQIAKEPISSKGPRLSCELSIPGRYLVLVPFSNTVNISKKITSSEERKRLLRLISSIKPENFGVIIRTVAEGKDIAELHKDLENLEDTWKKGVTNLKTAKPREKVVGEMGRASSIIRDMLNESFDSIVIDDEELFEETKTYVQQISPKSEKLLKHYNGRNKIFEAFGIEKQLKSLFGKSVSIPGGGYLIIEHTEALHVIDVNSGNKSNTEDSQEATALKINLQAAKEIARQLRLRDMGGIIVVDFIDMRSADHRKQVYQHMKQEMGSDRSKFTVLPLSKFGLMQITRQRVRPELNIITREKCPTCDGTGKIAPTILISDQIEQDLDHLLTRQNEKSVHLYIHPFIYSHFRVGFPSQQMKWFFKYKKWVKLFKDSSLPISEYKFTNGEEEDYIEV